MEFDDFDLSPDDLLQGLPARRASTLLFAVESRTAQLVAREHQETAVYLTESAAASQPEELFLDAIAAGREADIQPSIQEIERFAPYWAPLFPAGDASSRAAVAHLLGEKYHFTKREAPQIQAALGVGEAAVAEAYERLYKQSPDSIYVPQVPLRDRLRWSWAGLAKRLENMPPFWLAFFLTVPRGTGLLALPIVLAPLGLRLGLVILLAFGLLNLVTVLALAEAVARSGTTRLGMGFLGQLVDEYLGHAGSVLLSTVAMLGNFLVLVIFFVGLGRTLESSTGLPAELWVGAILLVCFYYLSKRSLHSTVASTLIIVFGNVLLLLLIPLLSLPYFDARNLVTTPEQGNITLAIIGPILGVMLSTYLPHFLIATYCPVVLRRDPSARTWLGGSAAALLFFISVAAMWLIVTSGVVPNAVLANTTGTVLVPLVEAGGWVIAILGSLLVSVALGLACIQVSLAQFYSIQERLPRAGTGRSFAGFLGGLGERGRFWLAVTPMFLIFILAEMVTWTGIGSFGHMLGFLGTFSLPLIGGIFPVLLLASTRRKGDFVPGTIIHLLGNRLLLGTIYLFYVGSILFHGLFIFESLLQRVVTMLTGLAILLVTVRMLRRGAMDHRLVVQVVDDQTLGGQPSFSIVDVGELATADVTLDYATHQKQIRAGAGAIPAIEALRQLGFQLGQASSERLKLWSYRLTPANDAVPLLVEFTLTDAAEEIIQTGHIGGAGDGDQILLSLADKPLPATLLVRADFGSQQGG